MKRFAGILLILAAAASLSGCESARSLNPFAEKDKVLAGERRPVFAPGSDFSGPRKLPPPNSDYIGATMPANQPVATAPAPGTQPPPPPAQ